MFRYFIFPLRFVFKLIVFITKARPKMRQFFEFLKILNKKAYFLVSLFVKLVIISDLTIRIRSTVLKNGVFEECL